MLRATKRPLMGIPFVRMMATVGTLTCMLTMAGCARSSVAASISGAEWMSGAELVEACVPCHGAAGEGSTVVGAPAIAGLPAWYVSAQLERFQKGIRGQHADDIEGLKMQAMSRQLRSETETRAVARHVASLPHVTNTAAIGGGAAAAGRRGDLPFASCPRGTGDGVGAGNVPPPARTGEWEVAAPN